MEGEDRPLRRGWTTGTCAAGAAKAACAALLTGAFPDPVEVPLPGGQRPAFALAQWRLGEGSATAAIVKDAGDDPDVTHGALVCATVKRGPAGSGITFRAGRGVGVATRPGLPIAVGEPAINPVPRRMIAEAIGEVAGMEGDFEVEIAVEDGEEMARKTLNGRLGIVGGLSILGTTGIVIPYSCSAWIASIHRGVDVARAMGLGHVIGATGSTSEVAAQKLHGAPETALIDMGDFVGGMLKYIRAHPVAKVTVAGGVAKMSKLAQGLLDLHSKRGLPDLTALADIAIAAGATAPLPDRIGSANTVAEAFDMAREAGVPLGAHVARAAWETAAGVLGSEAIALEILVFDRDGKLVGHVPFAPAHSVSRPLNRR